MVNFDCNKSDNILTVRLIGRLDTENSQIISGKIDEQIRKSCELESDKSLKIIFDIKEVEYIASAFIRTCVKAAKMVNTGNFSLVNASPLIKKIFKISGLDEMLHVS